MSMKTKGVSFNMEDPHQAKLYEFACNTTNFSGLVKNLLSVQMEQSKRVAPAKKVIPSSNGGIVFKVD